MTDDHGDQFPGAVPAQMTAHRTAPDDHFVRMHAAYLHKTNALVGAGRDDLIAELAESFAAESAGARRPAARRTPTRGEAGRRPRTDSRLGRLRHITRRSLRGLDSYTLGVFNPGSPYRRNDG